MENLVEEKLDIKIVKRYIKNLISGNKLSDSKILEMYQDALKEQIEKRIDKIMSGNSGGSIERIIRRTVYENITRILNFHIKTSNVSDDIEAIIRKEVNKQISEIVKNNIKITLST